MKRGQIITLPRMLIVVALQLVTEEGFRGNRIPTVCEAEGINCINILELMRRDHVQFPPTTLTNQPLLIHPNHIHPLHQRLPLPMAGVMVADGGVEGAGV